MMSLWVGFVGRVKATDCRVDDSEESVWVTSFLWYFVPAKMWDHWAARYNMDDVVYGVCQVKWIRRASVEVLGRKEEPTRGLRSPVVLGLR